MKNLEKYAQMVWNTSKLEEKKCILNQMIDSFQHKAKGEEYKQLVETTMSGKRLDQLAANFMLRDTDKVI